MPTEDGFEDRFTPPPGGDVPPSAGSDWLYPIQNVPDAAGQCPADDPGCTWNHTVPDSWQLNRDEATTQLFYFVNTFHDHLPPRRSASTRRRATSRAPTVLSRRPTTAPTPPPACRTTTTTTTRTCVTRPDGIPG